MSPPLFPYDILSGKGGAMGKILFKKAGERIAVL
jgi:hypothetical protein